MFTYGWYNFTFFFREMQGLWGESKKKYCVVDYIVY